MFLQRFVIDLYTFEVFGMLDIYHWQKGPRRFVIVAWHLTLLKKCEKRCYESVKSDLESVTNLKHLKRMSGFDACITSLTDKSFAYTPDWQKGPRRKFNRTSLLLSITFKVLTPLVGSKLVRLNFLLGPFCQ